MRKEIIGGYGIVAKGILTNPDIPIGAKGLYGYLSTFSDGENECFPSYATMAKEMNLSEKTIKKHIQTLVDFGILTKRQRRNNGTFSSNMYRIDHNACSKRLEGTKELPLIGDAYISPKGKNCPTAKVPDGKNLPYDRSVKSSLRPEGKNYPTNNTNINNTNINNIYSRPTNRFHNFEQRDYDYPELEKRFIQKVNGKE